MTNSLHLALILTGGLVFGSISALAAEPLSQHPACTDPRFEHWRYEAQELIDIAYSCDSPAAVRLFLNRADYLRLWDRWGHLSRIDGTDEVGRKLLSNRLFIALVESFVHEMPPTSPGWMVTLNQAYEQGLAVSDRALRGFEH